MDLTVAWSFWANNNNEGSDYYWDYRFNLILTAVISIIGGSFLFRRSNKKKNNVPHLRGLPFVGCANQVLFKSPAAFVRDLHAKYGDKWTCKVGNMQWMFVLDGRDVKYLLTLSEKKLSFIEAFVEMAGFIFPKDKVPAGSPPDVQALGNVRKTSASPIFGHAVRAPIMNAWIPQIRDIVRKSIQRELNKIRSNHADDGNEKVDFFQLARDCIMELTTVLMLGREACQDEDFSRQWKDIFQEANADESFSNSSSAISGIIEAALLGERRIFTKVRQFLYPLLDNEIAKCIDGKPISDTPSALEGSVRYRYTRQVGNDADKLRCLRRRMANDIFFFTTAAYSNSFAGAVWAYYHIVRDTNGCGTRVKADLNNMTDEELNAGIPESLKNVVLEVTRLYTPGTVLRKALDEDIVLPSDGTVIPANCIVTMSAFHSMRQGYTNPLSFDPERFTRGEQKDNIFFGFGAGAHPCVGKHLAMLEICIFVQECLRLDLKLAKEQSKEIRNDALMDPIIDIKDHPNLRENQAAFLWRPENPIYVEVP